MTDAVDAPRSPAAIFADLCRAGRLAYPAAPDGTPVWPPALVVPATGEAVSWRESSGRGVVYASTALHSRDAAPRNIAIVELDEGYRMMACVEGLPGDQVPIGLRVRVRFEPAVDEDVAPLPVFIAEQGS